MTAGRPRMGVSFADDGGAGLDILRGFGADSVGSAR